MTIHTPGPWENEFPNLGRIAPILGEDRAPNVIVWLVGAIISTALFIGACIRWM